MTHYPQNFNLAGLDLRNLKFRAWIPKWFKDPIMREVYGIDFSGYPIVDVSSITVLKPDNSDYISIPSTEYTLMQFTGRKDKKGIDIYEGDIVRKQLGTTETLGKDGVWKNYEDMVVIMKDFRWSFVESTDCCGGEWSYDFDEIEVIGNVFQSALAG